MSLRWFRHIRIARDRPYVPLYAWSHTGGTKPLARQGHHPLTRPVRPHGDSSGWTPAVSLKPAPRTACGQGTHPSALDAPPAPAMGLRSTLCCDLTTLPARSASAALRGGASPPALCRSLGRPLPAWAVSDDRLPHAARQPSWGTVRQSVLRAACASPTPLRDAAPLRRHANARRLRAVGLRVTHATRAEVARTRGHLSPFARDTGSVAMAASRRSSRCSA